MSGLVTTAATRWPDRLALVQGDQSLSYAELAQRSDAVCAFLTAHGIGPGSTVGVWMDRGPAWPTALLGILKAGAAYLPLDVKHPQDRLKYILSDAGATFILVSRDRGAPPSDRVPFAVVEEVLDASTDAMPRPTDADLSALAYILYTSGTTGRPKGVCVDHGNLVHTLQAVAECYGLVPDDRVLQFSALTFDVAAEELFATLIQGATVVLRDAGPMPDVGELMSLVEQHGVSVLNLPASYWHEWVSVLPEYPPSRYDRLRLVVVGSEAVDAGKLATWQAAAPAHVRWLNAYGPTETTITATVYEPHAPSSVPAHRPSGGVVPIGRPLPGVRAYVLDASLNPVQPGVPGDLYIAGPGVARGYLGDPARTEASFLPDPWGEPGDRMFATRDRVRRTAEGVLEFLGRSDDQVKLRGFRIELAEIEHVLRTHPRVTDAAAVLREDRPGDRRLAGYVTSRADAGAEAGELSAQLVTLMRDRLPDYMVPASLVVLDALPRNANGKVDRHALPVPPASVEPRDAASVPRTRTEQRLSAIWSDVLGTPAVGVEDDFFHLGGHSLLATQMVTRVRREFRVEVTLRRLFDHPTLAGFAGVIERAPADGTAPSAEPIPVTERPARTPLSFSQHRMWFMDQLVPDNAFFNVAEALRLTGPVDVEALQGALSAIVERHEVLRTCYPSPGGQPHQVIVANASVPLDKVAAGDEEQARAVVVERIRQPFDLSQGPVIRAGLIQLEGSDADHVLWICIHHIAYDEWSNNQLLQELSALYTTLTTGRTMQLPSLPVQYADFAMWHREWVSATVREHQLGYWRRQLAGSPPSLPLRTDLPRPRRPSQRGAAVTFDLGLEVTAGLRRLADAQGCTPYMVLLTVFGVLLQRYGAGDDIPVATPVANRNRQETEPLIGLFFNTLVLRLDLSGEPDLGELLRRTKDVAVGAYEHQDVPFEQLVEELRQPRDPSRNPLAQVLFQLHNRRPGAGELTLPDVTAERFHFPWTTARLDLEWHLRETGDTFTGIVNYATDLFAHDTVARMVDDFETLVAAVLDAPDTLCTVRLAGAATATNGNADRSGGSRSSQDETTATVSPPTVGLEEIRQRMCTVWSAVLGLDEVGLNDDFFDLGGQSLLATQLIARIAEAFGVRIPLSELFDQSTVGDLVNVVAEAKGIAAEDTSQLVAELRGETC
ncbi:non-ribosomal peptide synthetase [Streptomyces caniscabiei]|uniref:Amino acid adenylation domain-containing protein n=1 Tax=Streptomyces caniscabiei TaxID=2746961 RepID=A0A927L6V9_9ACTN|nr:non-ribosomal peptide synthetase [Streptomyces caniscabiei]MBD9725901.1 amino acid adenylation domain-containing protein [Streptomyces caniscabiei]MDX3507619.1 non-ribosomal peptide synthetase [Streptomyces caniscabiei]MDX3717581.1 non-ribosomal peptide synthetase [Streptomyces caniscabiei]WEO25333.1 non-ribosomal peptide synthetase [Streptomyces caniscabiei]